MNYFDILPMEIVMNIFRLVNVQRNVQILRVCKKWYAFGSDSVHWQFFVLFNKSIEYYSLNSILSYGVTTCYLSDVLVWQMFKNEEEIDHEITILPLKHMTMKYCNFESLYDIGILALKFVQLQSLKLYEMKVSKFLFESLANLQYLKVLKLNRIQEIDKEGMLNIGNITRLKCLRIEYSPCEQDAVESLARNIPSTLEILSLNNYSTYDLTESLKFLAERCNCLMLLSLENQRGITEHGLKHIQQLNSLKYLSIWAIKQEIVSELYVLCRALKNLRFVNFFEYKVDDVSIAFKQNFANLTVLPSLCSKLDEEMEKILYC